MLRNNNSFKPKKLHNGRKRHIKSFLTKMNKSQLESYSLELLEALNSNIQTIEYLSGIFTKINIESTRQNLQFLTLLTPEKEISDDILNIFAQLQNSK